MFDLYHDSLNENVLLIECIYANEKSILSIGLLNKNHFDELNNKLVVKKIDDIDLKLLKTDISGF